MEDKSSTGKRGRLKPTLILLAVIVLFAYAFQVVKVDLEEPLKPRRQENLIGLIRSLARPDLFEYVNETRGTNMSLRMPCPETPKGSQVSFEGRLALLAPNCATNTQDVLRLTGEGFAPQVDGLVVWHPVGATIPRRVAEFKSDKNGSFEVSFSMPDIRETEEPQRLELVEVLSRRIVGPSDTAILGLEKIIETVLMALMASTIGTLLAIPISFMAARNLMRDVRLPMASIMATLILAPAAAAAGWWLTSLLVQAASGISSVWLSLAAALVTFAALGLALRTYLARATQVNESGERDLSSWLLTGAIALSLLLGLTFMSQVGLAAGQTIKESLGIFGFIGNFIVVLSDATVMLLPGIVGFIGVLIGMSSGGRIGQSTIMKMATSPARILTALLTVVGTAVLVTGSGMAIFLINLIGVRQVIPETIPEQLMLLALPAAAAGLIMGLLVMTTDPKRHYAIGLTTYTLTRGALNITRSIEPIMMGFVFVVWVGLGPFAGILALTLHSVADLGKLFSEQVENIEEGPREAITATGANSVQSVVYAVVPQIVPHYIAYIFYRWDINVRMSTIIGFVGGGGIGFVLQRFLNQLLYTKASVMVIAIAVVVTVLDYVSSRIRRRII